MMIFKATKVSEIIKRVKVNRGEEVLSPRKLNAQGNEKEPSEETDKDSRGTRKKPGNLGCPGSK